MPGNFPRHQGPSYQRHFSSTAGEVRICSSRCTVGTTTNCFLRLLGANRDRFPHRWTGFHCLRSEKLPVINAYYSATNKARFHRSGRTGGIPSVNFEEKGKARKISLAK